MLQGHGAGEAVIGGGGEGAPRFGLGHDVYDVRAGDGVGLGDDGPVQMLTALGGEIDAPGGQGLADALEQGAAHLRRG